MKANKISLLQIEDHNAYLYNTGAFSHVVLLDKNLIWHFHEQQTHGFILKPLKNAARPSNELTQNDTDHSQKHETRNRLLTQL